MRLEDDYPHLVPTQAFMTWKENWCFVGIDSEQRISTLFHFSLRPVQGEGIFTAKFSIDGWEHKYVKRSPISNDPTQLRPVANDHLVFEVVEPGKRFDIHYRSLELDADMQYTGRFPTFDFADGPKPLGTSTLGEIGLSVFPFNHYEQALLVEGKITIKLGDRAGVVISIKGWGNRDHSWGWRDDFQFRFHHWICASFDDKYVQGSIMLETSYPNIKHGGFLSSADGNMAVREIDLSDTYWDKPGEPLPLLNRDVRYRIHTLDGKELSVIAHLSQAYSQLFLNARSEDRSKLYQNCQTFCDYTLVETGQRGSGILETGNFLEGPGIADRIGRR